MNETTCPRCGAAIGAGDPHGLCPACLMRGAIELKTEPLDCGRCGAALQPAAHFCAQCGEAVAAAGPTTESDPLREALAEKLRGQYRIVRILGRGGMGVVYLARDLTLDREVAIKVVRTPGGGSAMYERFRREARTAAKLSHPNIVPLHAFGEVEGMPFFVMGYVRGESLAEKLRRDGRLPEEEGRKILAEIADALDHAHRQGIVHRDVKPDNVLIDDESGRALLTDFGIAKLDEPGATATRGVVGTPHYMSPEQAAGRPVDARSDIYSLGVMGFVLLAGRLPFEGSTPTEILSKHFTQDPPPLRSFAPALAESTVIAVERCLAKEAAARWPDARSLRVALGGTAESTLPDALQAIDGRGVLGAAAAIAWMIFVTFLVRGGAPPAIFAIHTGVILFIYATVLVNVRREGIGVREAQRVLWREPSWWLWWYPRRLRRPRNVWDRLPASVRILRSWPLFAVALVAVLLVGEFPNAFRSPLSFAIKVGMLAGWVVSWSLVSGSAARSLRRAGLGQADRSRVMISIPPSRLEFWSRPHIAAVLAPQTSEEREPGRAESPHDHLQMILRLGGELSGPLRPLGGQAAAAARQLVLAIGDDERRIEELARNLESGEEEKLREKIDSLRASAGPEEELAPMRQLLEKQLELIGELSARVEQAKSRRSRRVEMLRTLSLHLASLRARAARPSSDPGSLSDGVRALCEEIERHASTLSPSARAGRPETAE